MPPTLGDVIRRQRELNAMSVRQMARLAGISNPYLSQIERGLREPSEQVVDAIARVLDLSADTLFDQAGIRPRDDEKPGAVEAAIAADKDLKPAQRRALLETYRGFVAANGGPRPRPRPARRQ